MKKKILYIILAVFIFMAIISMVVGALDMTEITVEFDEIGDFHDGMAWIRHSDKFGFIDETGTLVIPIIYDAYTKDSIDTFAVMSDFYEGLASVSIDGKCGFIDKSGELVIPAIFDGDFFRGEWSSYMPMFNDGLARVKKDGKFGYINKAGEVVVPFEYAWAGDSYTGFFTEGLIRVSKIHYGDERKFGFIDTSGNVVVPLMYGIAQSFSNGLAAVTNDNDSSSEHYGFIDRTGKLVIPMEFYIGNQWVGFSSFNEYGFAVVWNGEGEEVIIWSPASLSPQTGDFFIVFIFVFAAVLFVALKTKKIAF